MSFDGKTSHVANITDAKKVDWQIFLSQWVGMLVIVALGLLAFQLEKVRKTIESHDKVIEIQMRMNDSSMLVTERALAYFEERQAAEKAREMKLRTEPEDQR